MATSESFRRVYLPYCLIKAGAGYVVVNRHYKPLGVSKLAWVNYDEHAVEFVGLGPGTAQKLSWSASDDLERIYLYNDGCKPTDSPKHWDAYQKRLAVLAGLKVKVEYE